MIGHLRGIILEKNPPQLLLEVNGIGYEIDAPMSTFYRLPDLGQEIKLLTHFVVREDSQLLYGFSTTEERTLFRTLLKVNGVGPRLALAILSSIEVAEFARCVIHHDTESLVRIPGIGKKTAERLVIEMRDKLSAWENSPEHAPSSNLKQNTRHPIVQDAISALIALGYKPQEASRLISKIDDGIAPSEEMIRRALREMMI